MKEVDRAIAALDSATRRLSPLSTSDARTIRRSISRNLRQAGERTVIALANRLVARDAGFDRFFAYEILTSHLPAMASLRTTDLRRLGRGMKSWGDVDTFACYVAGPVWREGQVADAEIARWACSSDRWWRRAAVVSTVPLNSRARGGSGDSARTLGICQLALDDRDPMVVKALSWALRELAKRAPTDVEHFLEAHGTRVVALVRREVRSKLETGLKTPRRRARR